VAKKTVVHAEVAGPQVSETGFTLTDNVQIDADTRSQYDAAVRQLEQKQYEQGIASLLKVTQRAPTATAPYIDLGIAYGLTGDFDKAEASFKRALELNPRHPIAYNELGLVYRKKGQFAEARASYEKAIALVPDFHFARLNLAILCDLYLADTACALANYEAYQRAMPDDKQAAIWVADLRTRASH
jgi:Flp pilus assembly protein TadD